MAINSNEIEAIVKQVIANIKDAPASAPAPKAKAPMSKAHPKWNEMLNAVLAGQYTWKKLEELYDFNEADLAEGKDWVINQMA